MQVVKFKQIILYYNSAKSALLSFFVHYFETNFFISFQLMRELPHLNEKNKERPLCYAYSIKARALIHAHFSRIALPQQTLLKGMHSLGLDHNMLDLSKLDSYHKRFLIKQMQES